MREVSCDTKPAVSVFLCFEMHNFSPLLLCWLVTLSFFPLSVLLLFFMSISDALPLLFQMHKCKLTHTHTNWLFSTPIPNCRLYFHLSSVVCMYVTRANAHKHTHSLSPSSLLVPYISFQGDFFFFFFFAFAMWCVSTRLSMIAPFTDHIL